MKKTSLSLLFLLLMSFTLPAVAAFTVESAIGDQDFIIDGVQYSAKSACYGFQVGDQVELPFGNTDGNCTETLIYNLRNNETCDAWCQYPL
ncbi:MAG: hypothetical protein V4501_11985 [Pseudomonadota bacterium]